MINEENSLGALTRTYVMDDPGAIVAAILADVAGTNPATGTPRYYTHDNLGSTRGARMLLLFACILACFPVGAAVIEVEGTDGAAIAQAVAVSAPGDTVAIPAGVFPIHDAVAPRSGTRILGAGQDETVLRFVGETPSVFMRLDGVEDVEIGHMTLDGAGNANATQGIAGQDSRRITIHHVTIRDLVKGAGFGPHGIRFTGVNPTRAQGVTDSVVADCRFENIGVGAAFGGGIRVSWGSSRNKILRNTIADTGRGGIFADNGATDNVIRFNTVSGSGNEGLGIEVWGGSDRSVIEYNTLDHWLSIGGCDQCAARHNTITDRSGTYKFCGIEAIGSHLIITDNVVDDGAIIGLSVSSPQEKDYVLWARNTVRACNQWGAQLQGEAVGAACHYFHQCTFEKMPVGVGPVWYPGDEGHGFRIHGNCRNVTFEDCTFRDNDRFGLQILGPNVDALHFLRCTITGNKGAAVSGPSDYTALEFTDCAVSGNGDDALPEHKPFSTPPPAASFTSPRKARIGEPVVFRNTSTSSGPPITAALWDLGAGLPVFHDMTRTETAAENVPALPPDAASAAFDAAGDYRVTLVVWDASGRAGRAEQTISITP